MTHFRSERSWTFVSERERELFTMKASTSQNTSATNPMKEPVCRAACSPASRCLLVTGELQDLVAVLKGFAGSVELLVVPYCDP